MVDHELYVSGFAIKGVDRREVELHFLPYAVSSVSLLNPVSCVTLFANVSLDSFNKAIAFEVDGQTFALFHPCSGDVLVVSSESNVVGYLYSYRCDVFRFFFPILKAFFRSLFIVARFVGVWCCLAVFLAIRKFLVI
mgnify:CR=1 FL=1